jgi:hypothetical protein
MTGCFRHIMLAFTMLAPAAIVGQAPASHYDPGATSRGQQRNPLDFLNQLNRKNTDLGQCIEDARRIAIESSIYELLFWVNVGTLATVIGFFLYILRLKGERKQMLVSTAQVLAKYQNQLATGHENYQRLHAVYREYLDDLDREKEPKLTVKLPQLKGKNAVDHRETARDVKAAPVAVMTVSPDQTQTANQAAVNDAVFQSLRQQITTLTQQLEQERQKNRKLRGE